MGSERDRLWEIWVTLQMELVDLARTLGMICKEFPEEAKAAEPAIEKVIQLKTEEAEKLKMELKKMGGWNG